MNKRAEPKPKLKGEWIILYQDITCLGCGKDLPENSKAVWVDGRHEAVKSKFWFDRRGCYCFDCAESSY